MGNCGSCEMDCLYCIERKETKFDFINQKINQIIPKNETNFSQVRQFEYTFVSATKKVKNDDITSVFTVDENTMRKKFNENNENNLIDYYYPKEMFSLQILNKKLDSDVNSQNINEQENVNNLLNLDTNRKYFEEINKEKSEEDMKNNSTLRYNNTNFKSANVSFLKYFEKIEDNSKNFDFTLNNKDAKQRLTTIFPIKFNYHKDKYINYFTDNSI